MKPARLLLLFLLLGITSSLLANTAEIEAWEPFQEIYNDNTAKVLVQFKTYANNCQNNKMTKYRFKVEGKHNFQQVYNWQLKYKDCNGQLQNKTEPIIIGGPNTVVNQLIESADYMFSGTYSPNGNNNHSNNNNNNNGSTSNPSTFTRKGVWQPKEVLYKDNQVTVEIQFKTYEFSCAIPKNNKFKYRIIGTPHSSEKFVNWQLKYTDCNGNLVTANEEILIGGPQAQTGWIESMDYTFAGKFVSKEIVKIEMFTVSGYVTDNNSNKGISGARVRISGKQNYDVYTNYDGYYSVSVRSGKYSVEVSKSGYRGEQRNIDVDKNKKSTHFALNYGNGTSTNNNSSNNNNNNNSNPSKRRQLASLKVGISYRLTSVTNSAFSDDNGISFYEAGKAHINNTELTHFTFNAFFREFGVYMGDIKIFDDETSQYNVGLYYSPFERKQVFFKLGYINTTAQDGWFYSPRYYNTPYEVTSLPVYAGVSFIGSLLQYELGYNMYTNTIDMNVGMVLVDGGKNPFPIARLTKRWYKDLEDRQVFMYSYENGAPLGFTFAMLHGDGGDYNYYIQPYFNYRMNWDLFVGMLTDGNEISEDGENYTVSTGSNYQRDVLCEANMRVSLGMTVRLGLPIWVYLGGAYDYHTHYEKYDYDDSSTGSESVWVHNTLKSEYRFYPETGVFIGLLRDHKLTVKIGSTLLRDENIWQFGASYNLD
ncbi:MAG: carboxypeptidase regulatory-like domain-containing protein [Cytophagales bacterium]|nr:carboxypeptidase regulatory-like domain-containing protein [Cytophagales bacterium]